MSEKPQNLRRKNFIWKGNELFLGKHKLMEIYEKTDHAHGFKELYYVKDYTGKVYDYYNLSRARENAKVFALDLLTLEHARMGQKQGLQTFSESAS